MEGFSLLIIKESSKLAVEAPLTSSVEVPKRVEIWLGTVAIIWIDMTIGPVCWFATGAVSP